MASAPETLDHPTFGPCTLVPSIVAIKWLRPRNPEALEATLSSIALKRATTTPPLDNEARRAGGPAETGGHDPRLVNINNSDTLTWASAKTGKKTARQDLESIAVNADLAWVAPVYQADAAEQSPLSYFAINPTVLRLRKDSAGYAA